MVTAKKASKPATPKTARPPITITKTGTCKTLNGKSKLEYAVGKDADNKMYYRINKNDGGGHYSHEWLAADAIQTALAKADPITAYPLRNLSTGKSVNTAGFILAVLLAEGVVEQVPKKTRHYRFTASNSNRNTTPAATPSKPTASPAKKSSKPAKK